MERWGYTIIRSSLCNVGVVWVREDRGIEIARIFLFKSDNEAHGIIRKFFPKAQKREDNKINPVLKKIERYLKGKFVHFALSSLRKTICSRFQWSVFVAVKRIPYGKVSSYKDIAEFIGVKSARAVGNALAKNPFPIMLPCHRVVCANGKLGGFSQPVWPASDKKSGQVLKQTLLKLEGIIFDKKGKIPHKFFYSLDTVRSAHHPSNTFDCTSLLN